MSETLLEAQVVARQASPIGQDAAGTSNGVDEKMSEIDLALWLGAYREALGRGAGQNVARFYANQKLLYLRRDRDGIGIAGERDYAAYR